MGITPSRVKCNSLRLVAERTVAPADSCRAGEGDLPVRVTPTTGTETVMRRRLDDRCERSNQ